MQGIVSILGSDNLENTTKSAPIADMSSDSSYGLPDNGKAMIKNTVIDSFCSPCSSSSDQEKCDATGKGDEIPNPRRIDVWTVIMSQKKQDASVNLPSPYVHPLIKKSGSSLSEKSLKVCTESLGSETGSDVFSSNPSYNKNDNQLETKEPHKVVRLPCFTTKRSQQSRSFPPPVSSLATTRTNGPSVNMHARRVDGRLVVEAVSVAPQKYFEAQRQDGRFLLSLINEPKQQPTHHNLEDVVNVSDKDEIKIGSGHKDMRPLKSLSVKMINTKEGKIVDMVDQPLIRLRTTRVPLLRRVPAASASSYEYFWRAKPRVASVIDPLMRPSTKTKDLVRLKGNTAEHCLLPSSKGCKELRRSHLMWDTFCIATT